MANVKFVDQEATSFAREWGNPVVSLDVRKRAGENLIIASDEINRIIEEAKAEFLPSDLNVSITSDQSDQTRGARTGHLPPCCVRARMHPHEKAWTHKQKHGRTSSINLAPLAKKAPRSLSICTPQSRNTSPNLAPYPAMIHVV